MFEPMRARLASSFSRNGMSAAATETSCLGETSMKSMSCGRAMTKSPLLRQIVDDVALGVELDVGLANRIAALLHGGEIDDLVGHPAVLDAAIRALDEAVLVDPRESRKTVDEADIRPFRRLDWADTAIMRRMHVAHLEAGALARQPTRPERRETPFMRDLGERVRL